jgi:hypothetical protein
MVSEPTHHLGLEVEIILRRLLKWMLAHPPRPARFVSVQEFTPIVKMSELSDEVTQHQINLMFKQRPWGAPGDCQHSTPHQKAKAIGMQRSRSNCLCLINSEIGNLFAQVVCGGTGKGN